MQAMEEQCHRQSLMTARLVEERNAVFGIAAPFDSLGSDSYVERTNATMYAPYPIPKLAMDSRSRGLLPPSSRSAKSKDSQGRTSAHLGITSKKGQELMNRRELDGGDLGGQSGGLCDQSALGGQSLQPPLKTWGSTGKRQPSRPRHKA